MVKSCKLLFKSFLEQSTKLNTHIEKSLMIGILRLAKGDLYSGANMFMTYGVMDSNYSEYFGFT